MIITKTWLSANLHYDEITLPDYCFLRKGAQSHEGSVATLYKKCFKLKAIPVVVNIESLGCKPMLNDYNVYIAAIYRPSNKNGLFSHFHSYIHPDDKIMMAEDFNLSGIGCFDA